MSRIQWIVNLPWRHSILAFPWVPLGHSQAGTWRTTVHNAPGAHEPGQGSTQLPPLHANHVEHSSSTVHSSLWHPVYGLPRAPELHSHVAACPRATQRASAPQRIRRQTFVHEPPSQLSSSGQSLLLWHWTKKYWKLLLETNQTR